MIGDLEENSFSGVEEAEELNCSKMGVNRKASSEYRELEEDIFQGWKIKKDHLFLWIF